MKLGIVLLVGVFLSLVAVACSGFTDIEKESDSGLDEDSTLSKVALEVPTIWCSRCQPRVEASAKSVLGVREVRFDNQTVIVIYDPEQTIPDAIVDAIERGGDRVTKVTDL